MSKVLATENAPAAIGPYVQGVDLGSMIITSGQIPVNPKTGAVPEDVAAQARQSLENVQAIVESAGLKVGDIVKVMETRPLSATKRFRLVEIVKKAEII